MVWIVPFWQMSVCKSKRLEIVSYSGQTGHAFCQAILHVFFIFILHLHHSWMLTLIYADDSTLTFSSRWNANKSFMEKNINEDLEHVVNWSKMNKMVISQTKKNLCWRWESNYGNVWTALKWIWNSLWMGLLSNRLKAIASQYSFIQSSWLWHPIRCSM